MAVLVKIPCPKQSDILSSLQAVYSKERCPSRVNLSARPLADCLSNFHSSVEEVIIGFQGLGHRLRGLGRPPLKPLLFGRGGDSRAGCQGFRSINF